MTLTRRLSERQRRELWDLMTIQEREAWLRRNATPAEVALCGLLELDPRLAQPRYRFQGHCCGFYADFLFPRERLVIELDGAVHTRRGAKIADAARTRELARAGYRVIRFWNSQVLREPAGVLNRILRELGEISGESSPALVSDPAHEAEEFSLESITISTRRRRPAVKRAGA